MKRGALALLLALCLAGPASAQVLVLYNYPVRSNSANPKQVGPFVSLLQTSHRLGPQGVTVLGDSTDISRYTGVELRDSITTTAVNPKYKFGLIVVVNGASGTPACSLSRVERRPKVPVMYYSIAPQFNVGGNTFTADGGCSLGTANQSNNVAGMSVGPSGFERVSQKQRWVPITAAKPYITPVEWASRTSWTPGVYSLRSVTQDSMHAWIYNPPISTVVVNGAPARSTVANTAGYGCFTGEHYTLETGSGGFPSGTDAVLAVGVAAYLAPDEFSFPAVKIALDIDDGCKRLAPAIASWPQVSDYLSGLDSLNAWSIPYTVGIETDSMRVADGNGIKRIFNETAKILASGVGKLTVHNHEGVTTGGGGGDINVRPLLGTRHADIFGHSTIQRFAFGRAGALADTSLYRLLKAARDSLDAYATPRYNSRAIMPPTDDWMSGAQATFCGLDSIALAIRAAGFTVVRSQFSGNTNLYTTVNATVPHMLRIHTPGLSSVGGVGAPHLNIIASAYYVGGSGDTTFALSHSSTRFNVAMNFGGAIGRMSHFEDGSNDVRNAKWSATWRIGVTHVANWRAGITTPSSTEPRPAWFMVRQMHGIIEDAKWMASRRARASGAFHQSGPIKWAWADELAGAKDVR